GICFFRGFVVSSVAGRLSSRESTAPRRVYVTRMRKQLLWVFLAPLASISFAADSAPGLETIRADALKGHIFFLASDAMAGRDSMSREGRIAADYIAGFFYRAGLKPVGDGGTFFQNFP